MDPDNPDYQNFNYYWNSFWLVVVTMSTGNTILINYIAGFGDFYPVTTSGRIAIILSSFWGIFLVSQFVNTIQESSQFSLSE